MIDSTVTLGERRELKLPAEVCERLAWRRRIRYGWSSEMACWCSFVLLNQAIDQARLDELARWQAASLEAIAMFPWGESEP